MSESDGIEEAFDGAMRVAVAAAGQVAQHLAVQREKVQRALETASEAEAAQLRARLAVERQSARAQLAPVHDAAWWDRARPFEVADLYATAKAWEQYDPEAHRAADRMRTETRTRYGLDADTIAADPRAVTDFLAHAAGEDMRRRAQQDAADVALLVAAERAERALLDTDPERSDDRADALHESSEVAYDSAERRAALAAELEARGVDSEPAAARVRVDVSQAQPATEAIRSVEGGPKARKRRVRGVARTPRTQLGR